jgi:hypothetical protein
MRIDADESSVNLTERPVAARVFGAFSAVVGGFTAGVCLRFYAPGGDWGDLTLALFVPFLVVFSIAGLWGVLTLPTTICRVDGQRRVVELSRSAPLGRRHARWTFDDIEEVRAEAHAGADTSWRIALVLRDGRRVALLSHADDRDDVQRFVLQARRIMTTG